VSVSSVYGDVRRFRASTVVITVRVIMWTDWTYIVYYIRQTLTNVRCWRIASVSFVTVSVVIFTARTSAVVHSATGWTQTDARVKVRVDSLALL